jgi:hypothetical protein
MMVVMSGDEKRSQTGDAEFDRQTGLVLLENPFHKVPAPSDE